MSAFFRLCTILFLTSALCSCAGEDKAPDISDEPYTYTRELKVYEIASSTVREIITECVIPKFNSMYTQRSNVQVYIDMITVDDTPILRFMDDENFKSHLQVTKDWGWFTMDEFEFFVDKSAELTFSIDFRDPWYLGFVIKECYYPYDGFLDL